MPRKGLEFGACNQDACEQTSDSADRWRCEQADAPAIREKRQEAGDASKYDRYGND